MIKSQRITAASRYGSNVLVWLLVYTKNVYLSKEKSFRFDRHSRLAAKR